MYWRVGSFPELEHFSEQERGELLRAALPRKPVLRLVASALALGLFSSLFACNVMRGPAGTAFRWSTFALVWPTIALVVYQIGLALAHSSLRDHLVELAKHQRLPLCLNCGYGTKGLPSKICPECGRRVDRLRQC